MNCRRRSRLSTVAKPERLPQHVAIIMDGNGRWAGRRSLKRFLGHQQGAEAVQYVVETASRIDLPWLTLYAFSLENNLKPAQDGSELPDAAAESYLINNVQRMNDNNVRIAYIGRTHELPTEVQEQMQWAAEATARNTGTVLTLALNYGARSELVDAFAALAAGAGSARAECRAASPKRTFIVICIPRTCRTRTW